MPAFTLLNRAREAGLAVEDDADALIVRGPKRLEALASELLANKADVMLVLAIAKLPSDLRVEFEERAAIREYCGNLPREQAEREALREIHRRNNETEQG